MISTICKTLYQDTQRLVHSLSRKPKKMVDLKVATAAVRVMSAFTLMSSVSYGARTLMFESSNWMTPLTISFSLCLLSHDSFRAANNLSKNSHIMQAVKAFAKSHLPKCLKGKATEKVEGIAKKHVVEIILKKTMLKFIWRRVLFATLALCNRSKNYTQNT